MAIPAWAPARWRLAGVAGHAVAFEFGGSLIMCSIFAIVLRDSRPVPVHWVEPLQSAMRHRGPDGQGLFQEPGILLGNDRLAIIDTVGGAQPMFRANGRYVIVYNGEIFNHVGLRRELERRGSSFHTQSDTETVLGAFEAYGPACVERLNGMFAFVVWDRVERRLFVARDRLGIKPLYYCAVPGGVALASEAKALLHLVPGGAQVNWTAIHRYFTFGYVPPPESPFAGIAKISAGHSGWIDARGDLPEPHLSSYWRPNFGCGSPVAIDEAVQRVDTLLGEAVGLELMSDVPVGLFLSGGLDSSAVAYHAARLMGRNITSFALRFEESTHDESSDARAVAQHLGLEHRELTLTPTLMREGLDRVAAVLDEPFGDSTVVPLLVLSEFARQQVKVVLTGWGGDEIFAGYPTLTAHRAARLYRRFPALFRRLVDAVVDGLPVSDRYLSFEFKAKRFVRGMELAPELQHFLWMGYFDDEAKRRLFAPGILARVGGDTLDPVAEIVCTLPESELVDRIMHLDASFFLQGNGLFQADRMTMAASLEARVPLLNNTLLDYVMALPARVKMSDGTPKGLLRRVMRDRLPPSILNKPKKGFGPPSSIWTRGVLAGLLEELFSEERVRQQGIFVPEEIRRLIREHRQRLADHGRSLWALLSFQLWYDRFVGAANGLRC